MAYSKAQLLQFASLQDRRELLEADQLQLRRLRGGTNIETRCKTRIHEHEEQIGFLETVLAGVKVPSAFEIDEARRLETRAVTMATARRKLAELDAEQMRERRNRLAELEREIDDVPQAATPRIGDVEHTVNGLGVAVNRESYDLGGFREIIAPQAVRNLDLSGVVSQYEHRPDFMLGSVRGGTLKLNIDAAGNLWYRVRLPRTRVDVAELIMRGDVLGSSFRFKVARGGESWSRTADGQPLRTVRDMQYLREVGPVTDPAYPTGRPKVIS